MHLIGFLIMGAIVGWLAGKVMSGHGYGIIWDVVLGIVGSFAGGFVFSLIFGTQPTGLVISFIVALIGAIILVAIVHMVKREPIRTAWEVRDDRCPLADERRRRRRPRAAGPARRGLGGLGLRIHFRAHGDDRMDDLPAAPADLFDRRGLLGPEHGRRERLQGRWQGAGPDADLRPAGREWKRAGEDAERDAHA